MHFLLTLGSYKDEPYEPDLFYFVACELEYNPDTLIKRIQPNLDRAHTTREGVLSATIVERGESFVLV